MSSIRTLWIFCLLAAILTVQTAPAIANDSITNIYCSKMVRSYIQKARGLAKTGDLAGARNDVFLAWFFYSWTHHTRFIAAGGELTFQRYEYLFPQGKEFCLFDWIYGQKLSRIIYAQVRGNTFIITWQAQLEQSDASAPERNTGKKVEELAFVSAEGYRIVREVGRRPPADTALVFFKYMFVPDTLIYGRIDSSGAALPMGGWNHRFPPTQWLKYRVPYRMPTHREYLQELSQQNAPNINMYTSGQFRPNRPGSRSGHLIGQFFELPKIPGEMASPGEVSSNKSGGNSSSAGAAVPPANIPSGSIDWTWTSHPVTVGEIVRHTDAKHPATIGDVHIKARGFTENWRVEVFMMDSAGVKCVVMDEKGHLVAVTLVMIGQCVKGNFSHHVGIRLFRTDVDRWPQEYIWGGGGAKRDSDVEGQTKNVVVLSRVLQFPGHLNLGVAEWH